jgi:hypothetical protein
MFLRRFPVHWSEVRMTNEVAVAPAITAGEKSVAASNEQRVTNNG